MIKAKKSKTSSSKNKTNKRRSRHTDSSNRKPKTTVPRPPRRFGHKSARTVKEALCVLEKSNKQNILILTLTLPGSTSDAINTLTLYGGFAVNRVNQYFRNNIKSPLYVWVWELQAREAPHLHYAIYIKDKRSERFSDSSLQEMWIKVLQDISKESGVDLFARAQGGTWRDNSKVTHIHAQYCETSVVGYFSKYSSKQSQSNLSEAESSPGNWYRVSKALFKEVKAQRLEKIFEVDSEETALQVIDRAKKAVEHLCGVLRDLRVNDQKIGSIAWAGAKNVPEIKRLLSSVATAAAPGRPRSSHSRKVSKAQFRRELTQILRNG